MACKNIHSGNLSRISLCRCNSYFRSCKYIEYIVSLSSYRASHCIYNSKYPCTASFGNSQRFKGICRFSGLRYNYKQGPVIEYRVFISELACYLTYNRYTAYLFYKVLSDKSCIICSPTGNNVYSVYVIQLFLAKLYIIKNYPFPIFGNSFKYSLSYDFRLLMYFL